MLSLQKQNDGHARSKAKRMLYFRKSRVLNLVVELNRLTMRGMKTVAQTADGACHKAAICYFFVFHLLLPYFVALPLSFDVY